jgi:hypothetical protein
MEDVKMSEMSREEARAIELSEIRRKLRNISSRKTRLNKMQEHPEYQARIDELLKEEHELQLRRNEIEPADYTVTKLTQEQVDDLGYDEVIRALKSISSKKSNTRFDKEGNEHQLALKIEAMLQVRRDTLKPVNSHFVRKSHVRAVIEKIETHYKKAMKKEDLMDMLQELLKDPQSETETEIENK